MSLDCLTVRGRHLLLAASATAALKGAVPVNTPSRPANPAEAQLFVKGFRVLHGRLSIRTASALLVFILLYCYNFSFRALMHVGLTGVHMGLGTVPYLSRGSSCSGHVFTLCNHVLT